MSEQLDPMTLAEHLQSFLSSDAGLEALTAFNNEYNSLHHGAEATTLQPHERLSKIDKASGVKWCIDWFMTRKQNLEAGRYKR